MNVSVLVPYRDNGCSWRARAWEYIRRHYTDRHGRWQLVIGACEGPWSKGLALADALGRADGEVLVLADADSFVDPQVLNNATLKVAAGADPWAVPHTMVHRLSRAGTEMLYAGTLDANRTCRRPYMGVAGGGIVVVARAAYEAAGGVDPRFYGWGGEDMCLGWALNALVGQHRRHGARLIHLWHPSDAPRLNERGSPRGSDESEALAARYRIARHDPARMAAVVSERSVSLGS